MPLPYYYKFMPYGGDNHYGKEIFTKRYFLFKQKAFYPILFLVGTGVMLGSLTTAKNALGNANVTMMHSHQGLWGSKGLNTLDLAKTKRQTPAPVLDPIEETKL